MKRILFIFLILSLTYTIFPSISQSITGINPASGRNGETLTISFTGSGTNFTQATANSNACTDILPANVKLIKGTTIYQSSKITVHSNISFDALFSLPTNAPLGNYNVEVKNNCPATFPYADSFLVVQCQVPSPPDPIIGSDSVCLYNSNNYSVPVASGVTYSWVDPDGGDINYSGNNATVVWNKIGKHILTVVAHNACTTKGTSRTLNVQAVSYISKTEPEIIIPGQSMSLTFTGCGTNFDQASPTMCNYISYENVKLIQGFKTYKANSASVSSTTSMSAQFFIPSDAVLGNYNVEITNSCLDTFRCSNCLFLDDVTSTWNRDSREIAIFPNPNNGAFLISVSEAGQHDLQIVDLMGKELKRLQITNKETDLELLNIKAGFYTAIISNNKRRYTKKIIIQ